MARVSKNSASSAATRMSEQSYSKGKGKARSKDNKGTTSRGRSVIAGKTETRAVLKNHDALLEKYRAVVNENLVINGEMHKVESNVERYCSKLNELLQSHGKDNIDNSNEINGCLHGIRDKITCDINSEEGVSPLEKTLLENKLKKINDLIHDMETSNKEECKSTCYSVVSALIGFVSGVGVMVTANAASVSTMLAYSCGLPVTPVNIGLCACSYVFGRKIHGMSEKIISNVVRNNIANKFANEIKEKELYKQPESNMETETGDKNRDDSVVDSSSEMDGS